MYVFPDTMPTFIVLLHNRDIGENEIFYGINIETVLFVCFVKEKEEYFRTTRMFRWNFQSEKLSSFDT